MKNGVPALFASLVPSWRAHARREAQALPSFCDARNPLCAMPKAATSSDRLVPPSGLSRHEKIAPLAPAALLNGVSQATTRRITLLVPATWITVEPAAPPQPFLALRPSITYQSLPRF